MMDHTIGGEEGRESSETTTTTTTTTSTAICPMSYSMTFPRYRIEYGTPSSSSSRNGRVEYDKRRTRRLRRGIISKLVPPPSGGSGRYLDDASSRREDGGIFGNALKLLTDVLWGASNPDRSRRRSVESHYEREITMGNFRWVSSSSPPPPSPPSGRATDSGVRSRNADEDFISAAAFWEMASDIVVQLATDETIPSREDDDVRGRIVRYYYMALPETTPAVARKLCDIMNWYADILSGTIDGAAGEGGGMVDLIMRSDLDSRCDENEIIPVVVFSVTFDDGARRRLSRRYERRNLLPKAMDTEKRTKAWVKRLLVQLGICPFTKSEIRSGQGLKDVGVPVASIMYRHSEALGEGSDVYLLMAGE